MAIPSTGIVPDTLNVEDTESTVLFAGEYDGARWLVIRQRTPNTGSMLVAKIAAGLTSAVYNDTSILAAIQALPEVAQADFIKSVSASSLPGVLKLTAAVPTIPSGDLKKIQAEFKSLSKFEKPTNNTERIYMAARACTGRMWSKFPVLDNGNLGCAWAVNEVVKLAINVTMIKGYGTDDIYKYLKDNRILKADIPSRGCIVISPTEGIKHGHVGIVGEDEYIYSNGSSAGVFLENYDVGLWMKDLHEKRGLKVEFYSL